jgi:hypothetical protein
MVLQMGTAQAGLLFGERGNRCVELGGALRVTGDYATADTGSGRPDLSVSLLRINLTGNIAPSLSFQVQQKVDYGAYALLDCLVKYDVRKWASITAGQFRAPFGRFSNVSGAKLLFKERSPVAALAPGYQVGLAPRFCFLDNRYSIAAGVFDGDGLNVHINPDAHMMFAAEATVAPLGEVPMEESANRGYAKPVVALVAGAFNNSVKTVARIDTASGRIVEYVDVATAGASAGVVLRSGVFALDAGWTGRDVDDPRLSTNTVTNGWCVQAAYALHGRLEPAVRLSRIASGTTSTTTVEGGLNYYLDGYSSWLGLNYVRSLASSSASAPSTTTLALSYSCQF